MASSTAAAVRWSRMNTATQAVPSSIEGGYRLLGLWMGGGVRSWWRGGSRGAESTGDHAAETCSLPAIRSSPGANTGGGEG